MLWKFLRPSVSVRGLSRPNTRLHSCTFHQLLQRWNSHLIIIWYHLIHCHSLIFLPQNIPHQLKAYQHTSTVDQAYPENICPSSVDRPHLAPSSETSRNWVACRLHEVNTCPHAVVDCNGYLYAQLNSPLTGTLWSYCMLGRLDAPLSTSPDADMRKNNFCQAWVNISHRRLTFWQNWRE